MTRTAMIERRTKETEITARLSLEPGESGIDTGIGFFDHMLAALAFYGGFTLELEVKGDLHVDGHHTVEDTGIVLGQAIRQALGGKEGIARFASCHLPMDEALAFAALDISGRPFLVYEAELPQERLGDYEACLTEEFMRALAYNLGATLHLRCLYGRNSHHMTEAMFKALGLTLKEAVRVTGRGPTSTKGVL